MSINLFEIQAILLRSLLCKKKWVNSRVNVYIDSTINFKSLWSTRLQGFSNQSLHKIILIVVANNTLVESRYLDFIANSFADILSQLNEKYIATNRPSGNSCSLRYFTNSFAQYRQNQQICQQLSLDWLLVRYTPQLLSSNLISQILCIPLWLQTMVCYNEEAQKIDDTKNWSLASSNIRLTKRISWVTTSKTRLHKKRKTAECLTKAFRR